MTTPIDCIASSDVVSRSKLHETLKMGSHLGTVGRRNEMFFAIAAVSTLTSSNGIIKASKICNRRIVTGKAPVSYVRTTSEHINGANLGHRPRNRRRRRNTNRLRREISISIRVNGYKRDTRLLITGQFRRNGLHETEKEWKF